MSAWIVSKKMIDLFVTFIQENKLQVGKDPDQVGQLLWDENHRSVNYRYSEDTKTPVYKFEKFDLSTLKPIEIVKQVKCYDYQTCENDDYSTTPAYALMREIEAHASSQLHPVQRKRLASGTDIHDLVGWEAAPWGID